MSQVWIVTVPKNKESANNVYNTVSGPLEGRGSTQTFRFEIPDLVVGTLDSLMALSDDLNKIGSQVENVVRKIERQYVEISADKFKPLQVNNRSVEATIEKFQWDFAAFPNQGKPLSELIATVQNIAGKAEEELKGMAATYADKNLAYGTAKRRKVVNYGTSDFEDFLTPEDVARIEIFNTESLLTLTVVVPKSFEEEFNRTYFAIGNDIASYGGPDWSGSEAVGSADGKFGPKLKRDSVRGSPVVPKSLKLIKEDGESLLYAITVLRGQYQAGYFVDDVFTPGTFVDYVEPLKVAFREKRCIIRELTYDSSKSGGVDAAIREAKQDLAQTKTTVLQWCRAHFGEVYNAWLHLKVIQAFVESVLRYGLPIDFVSFFVSPDPKFDKDLKSQLLRSVLSLRPELRPRKALADEEEEEGDSADALPYVYVKFALVGGVAPASS